VDRGPGGDAGGSERMTNLAGHPKTIDETANFTRSLAVVIGIDIYSNGIRPLTTAVNDATRLADLLRTTHGYETILLTEPAIGQPVTQTYLHKFSPPGWAMMTDFWSTSPVTVWLWTVKTVPAAIWQPKTPTLRIPTVSWP
jgi:hypothetical protein